MIDIPSIALPTTREAIFNATQMMASLGVSAEEAAEACNRLAKLLPPPGPKEIMLIRMNPSLSRFQKRRIIRQIKRRWRGNEK